jgi:hypothetical protein
MALTAKEDIKLSFGEVEGGVTAASKGDELELIEDLGNTLNVKGKDGIDFYVTKEQVNGYCS